MSPETCVPTSTWSTGSSVPVAEMVVEIVVCVTFALTSGPAASLAFSVKKKNFTP